MNKRQKSHPWKFRYNYLEDWLSNTLSISMSTSKERARELIRSECEDAMRTNLGSKLLSSCRESNASVKCTARKSALKKVVTRLNRQRFIGVKNG